MGDSAGEGFEVLLGEAGGGGEGESEKGLCGGEKMVGDRAEEVWERGVVRVLQELFRQRGVLAGKCGWVEVLSCGEVEGRGEVEVCGCLGGGAGGGGWGGGEAAGRVGGDVN